MPQPPCQELLSLNTTIRSELEGNTSLRVQSCVKSHLAVTSVRHADKRRVSGTCFAHFRRERALVPHREHDSEPALPLIMRS